MRAAAATATLFLLLGGCTSKAAPPPVPTVKGEHALNLNGRLMAVGVIAGTDLAYVLDRTDVDVIDLPRARLVTRIGLGETGIALETSPDGRRVYVVADRQAPNRGGSLYAIDRIGAKVVRRLDFPAALQPDIVISADGHDAYVSDQAHLYRVNTNDLRVSTTTADPGPRFWQTFSAADREESAIHDRYGAGTVAVPGAGGVAFVAAGAGVISVLDARTLDRLAGIEVTVPGFTNVGSMAATDDGHYLVALEGGQAGELVVVDL